MNKLIRWPGLLAFAVISGLIAFVLIVFLDVWIKLAAVKGLEAASGAEVNIASVSHSFSPFGITLQDLQLTDPKQPSHNQVQAKLVTAQIDLAPLLLRKIIIDDLVVTGVKINQVRESEGAVYRKPEAIKKALANLIPSADDVPSVDEILAKSPLKTTKAVQEAQQAYVTHKDQLESKYKNLPSKDKLADYKARIQALTETDYSNPLALAKAKKEFDQIKQDISEDKQKLTEFKNATEAAKKELSPKIAQLKAAPGEDYAQLQALIAGDAAAINNVTQLVFGDKIAQWSDYALAALKLAGPMLAKNEKQDVQDAGDQGRWISFSDNSALPDLLIRHANISLSWQEEVIESVWQNLTYQHEILGRPTTFKVNSSKSKLWESLLVDGELFLKGDGALAKQTWQLAGLKLADLVLVEQEKLSSTLQKGLLSSSGKLDINQGVIAGKGLVDLAELSLLASGSNNVSKVIAETLQTLNKLRIETDISGILGDMDFSFDSDLNKQLAKAMMANLSGDQKGKLAELKQKLNAKIQGPLGTTDEQMGQLLDWEKLAEGDLSSINEMLSSKLSNAIEDKKDKLKDKLKGKLFG